MIRTGADWENQKSVMDVDEIIVQVENICRLNGVKKLSLFGSFAKGTAAFTSDIDFVVYGCRDIEKLKQDLEQIDTLRKIDIFEYEAIHNSLLLEDLPGRPCRQPLPTASFPTMCGLRCSAPETGWRMIMTA